MTLLRLHLANFRTYAELTLHPQRLVVLTGPNGSGKTNLLEAISLLVPGRGLRGARIADLARAGATAWGVHGRFAAPAGEVEIATGTAPDGPAERRVFRLDGQAPRNQAEIARHAAAIWLTPQMDRLFQEGPSGRRRFLDRLVFAREPGHAREIAAHDTAVANRNRLLAEGQADRAWLAGLEESIARHAVAATVARMTLVEAINAAPPGAFPAARLSLLCPIAARLAAAPALAVEDEMRAGLAASRSADAAAGGTSLGAHRTDFALADAASGLPAAQASTGQQKALLIGIILAQATLRATPPILLLDEPAVHLDKTRREALFAALAEGPAQAFLTGTDADVFAPLMPRAQHLRSEDGTIR